MYRRRQRRSNIGDAVFFDAEDVVSIAHEEDFADDAARVFSSYEKLAPNGEKVNLRALCADMDTDLRSVYLPLLFLMLDGRLVLYQEEFYGDIYVTLPGEVADEVEEDESVKKPASKKPRKRSKSKSESQGGSDEQTVLVDDIDDTGAGEADADDADDDADEGEGELIGNVY